MLVDLNQLQEVYLHRILYSELVKPTAIMETGWSIMIVQWVIYTVMLILDNLTSMAIIKFNLTFKETQQKNWSKTNQIQNQLQDKDKLDISEESQRKML